MATFGQAHRWPEAVNNAAAWAALRNPAERQKPRPGGEKFQATSHAQAQRLALRQKNEVVTKDGDATLRRLSLDSREEPISKLKRSGADEGPDTQPKAFSTSLLPTGVPDIDCDDAYDPHLCSQYAKDIYHYMFSLETKWPIRAFFLSSQVTVTANIRARVVNWLVEVHAYYALVPETLFLTVYLMDRYLQKHVVDKSKMLLLSVSSLFVASKFEETGGPLLEDLMYLTDYSCKATEVLVMEKDILRAVDWSLGRPSPLHFLRRNCKATETSSPEENTAVFLLELGLTDYHMASVVPSKQAAAALHCALQLHGRPVDCWDEKMVYYSGHSKKSLRCVVQRMAGLMLDAPNSQYKAVYEKFKDSRYDRVANISATYPEQVRKIARGIQ